MDIKTRGFDMPDGNTHIFIPPSPTETERGGIKAKKKTTETVEVAVGDDDKLYVPSVPDEKITEAVNTYLDENPVTPGATVEQAAQIDKNESDITELKGDIVSLENLLKEIQDKLNSSTVVDNITVSEINDMIVNYFQNKTVLEVEA